MKTLFDLQYFQDDKFDKIITELFSVYDLWSIRPLINPKLEFLYGTLKEKPKFSKFIDKHAHKEYACDLVVHIGVGHKNNPNMMLNRTKTSIVIRFAKSKENNTKTPQKEE
jgi:hypothetical protein